MTTTMPRAEKTTEHREPTLRADRRGYVVDGESVNGFADRPTLPIEAREKLARWARRFSPDELSEAQGALLEKVDREASPGGRELLRAALLDAERDVGATAALGFYQELSDEQLQLVRDPSRHPELGGREYPLTMKETEILTGATARQLRYWDRLGLLPAHRINNRRVFLGSAVARAFALKEAKQHEVAALAALARGGPEAARFARMLGSVLGSVARGLEAPRSRELSRAAELIVNNSRLLIEGVRDAGVRAVETARPDHPRSDTGRTGGSARARSRRGGAAGPSAARHVVPRQRAKDWAVVASPGGRPSSTHRRKSDAVKAARAVVAKRGGGKVLIHERTGKIVESRVSSRASGRSTARSSGPKARKQRALSPRAKSGKS